MPRQAAFILIGIGFAVVIVGGYLAYLQTARTNQKESMLALSSSSFSENGPIPAKYTCDGANVNPELSIAGVPAGAKSLLLIMDDPDIPQAVKDSMRIEAFDHWVLFNIPPDTKMLDEAATPPGVEGDNGARKPGYTGPCPPDREHRYIFTLYALDATLDLPPGASRAEAEKAAEGHVIEVTQLIGRYNRSANSGG